MSTVDIFKTVHIILLLKFIRGYIEWKFLLKFIKTEMIKNENVIKMIGLKFIEQLIRASYYFDFLQGFSDQLWIDCELPAYDCLRTVLRIFSNNCHRNFTVTKFVVTVTNQQNDTPSEPN
jgi:hypothetical protein